MTEQTEPATAPRDPMAYADAKAENDRLRSQVIELREECMSQRAEIEKLRADVERLGNPMLGQWSESAREKLGIPTDDQFLLPTYRDPDDPMRRNLKSSDMPPDFAKGGIVATPATSGSEGTAECIIPISKGSDTANIVVKNQLTELQTELATLRSTAEKATHELERLRAKRKAEQARYAAANVEAAKFRTETLTKLAALTTDNEAQATAIARYRERVLNRPVPLKLFADARAVDPTFGAGQKDFGGQFRMTPAGERDKPNARRTWLELIEDVPECARRLVELVPDGIPECVRGWMSRDWFATINGDGTGAPLEPFSEGEKVGEPALPTFAQLRSYLERTDWLRNGGWMWVREGSDQYIAASPDVPLDADDYGNIFDVLASVEERDADAVRADVLGER